jgi:WD40 repeat protein
VAQQVTHRQGHLSLLIGRKEKTLAVLAAFVFLLRISKTQTNKKSLKKKGIKKMRPILMKGHERPLTFLKYNREGDLLFSCAKDHNPTVWFADNGERLGTYRGHNGAVWCCDVSSKFLSPP